METKDNGTKTKDKDFGRCNLENIKEMFEKMSKCCPSQGDSFDFSTMKKHMTESCCGSTATDTKRHDDSLNK